MSGNSTGTVNTISVIGMGYVGLPLAVAFAEKGKEVIGFDINQDKIQKYQQGIDPTDEIGTQRLKAAGNLSFTWEESALSRSQFHIVAVPTPVGKNNVPNLGPVEGAARIVGRNLVKGTYVVFESTVYPGVTEELCIPILEKESGLKAGIDFKVGYSPERVNPGDRKNTLEKITKIVSGMDKESLEVIAGVYGEIIDAGIHKAPTIKVAEAAKVIENAQRDVNIAFVNELAMIFEKMGIDTKSVLEAAGTKWNFMRFEPGLVGGHCIGVDPYYLTYRSEELGYLSQLILAGRRINDGMSRFIAQRCVSEMIQSEMNIKHSKILVLGMTFKENCPDIRNSKVIDLIDELKVYCPNVTVYDPVADPHEAMEEYGIRLADTLETETADVVIIAVKHEIFTRLTQSEIKALFRLSSGRVLLDLKSILDKESYENEFRYWRL